MFLKQLILYVLEIQKCAMKLLALLLISLDYFSGKLLRKNLSGPDGGVQVEKQG
jgi:hypothetical protein